MLTVQVNSGAKGFISRLLGLFQYTLYMTTCPSSSSSVGGDQVRLTAVLEIAVAMGADMKTGTVTKNNNNPVILAYEQTA